MIQKMTRLLAGLMLIPLFLAARPPIHTADLHKSGNPAGTPLMDLGITIPNAAVQKGAEVCLPIQVTNFTSVVGMEFTITYDPTRLTFKSVGSFNLTGLNESSFGLPGVGVNQPGSIKVSWLDPNVAGVTVANNTAIFTVCFTAANADATTPVSINPQTAEIVVGNGTVPLSPTNSTVTIGAGGSGGGGGGGGGGGSTGTGTFTLDITDTTVVQGAAFCLRVRAVNFRDIIGMEMTINYNASALDFDSVGRYNLVGLNASSFGLPGVGANPPGSIKLSWVDPEVKGVTIPDSTTIFVICFKAKANNVTTNVTFAANAEITNKNEQVIPFNGDGGRVIIGTGSGSGGSGSFTLDVLDATAQSGQEVCVPVTTSNFSNILGVEFTLTYDPAKLQFVAVRDYNLVGLNENAFGLPGMGSNPVGTVKVSWYDPDGVGKSVANGTTLFRVCFTAIGSNTTAQVGFATASEVINSSEQIIPLNASPGTITITGSGGGGNNNLALVVGTKSAPKGQDVCLDVKVAKFTSIVGMEFTISYAPTNLQFKSVGSFNLNGLNDASFGLPGVGTNQPGSIKVAWVDPNVSGVTVADSTSIFQVCFTAIGNSGVTTPVTINPQLEVTNSNEQTVPVTIVNGAVNITGGSTGGGFKFILSDKNGSPNTDVCLDLSVEGFANIVGFEFNLAYDTIPLRFKEVKAFNLNGLAESSFGLPGVGINPAGAVKVSWVDPNVTGVTIPNGTVIFQVCFTAKPNAAGTTTVRFDTQKTIEVTDNKDQPVPYTLDNGIITFGGTVLPPTIVAPAQITNVNCFGASTGAINITVQGGSGNFTYKWSYQNASTQDLSNLPAGSYTVTVTDAGTQLTATQTFNVTQPASAVQIVSITPTSAACSGVNNGRIAVVAQGGTGTLSYAWSGGLAAIANPTNVAPGTYALTVTDANSCTATGNVTVGQLQGVSIASIMPTFIDAGNDGAVSISVTGGTGPYRYSWVGPGNFTQGSEDLTNLNVIGQYCVTVTDQAGCTATACTNLLLRLKFADVAIKEACSGQSNGSINVTAVGGQTPYSYRWNTGATAQNLSSLSPGTYTLTLTDASGTNVSGSFQVPGLTAITISGNVTAAQGVPTSANGSVTINVSGGKPNYSFRWSNGSTSPSLSNLQTGDYCVTVTDQNNCSNTACFKVELILVPLAFGVEATNIKCNGERTGSVRISISGGLSPYSVLFGDGSTQDAVGGVVERKNLGAGTVNFIVRDAANTTITGSAEVKQPTALAIGQPVVKHDTEESGCSGNITITVNGGTPGYNITWNNQVTGLQNQSLCEGTYTPTIEDANGCRLVGIPIPVNTFRVQGAVTDNDCSGDVEGKVDLSISGGSSPYAIAWLNLAGDTIKRTEDITDLASGTYRAVVRESSGNILIKPFTVNTLSRLTATAQVTSNFRGFGVSCAEATDGAAIVNPVNGAGSNYVYEWLLNNQLVGSQQRLQNAKAGSYTVRVTDSRGCLVENQITLTSPLPVAVTGSVNNISCVGVRDGEILVVAGGGVPGSLYTYRWNTNQTGPRLSFLAKGAYTVTATDANNCSGSASFTVEEPKPLGVKLETTPATDKCNGAARAVISGGNRPFTFRWNGSTATSDSVQIGLCPGDYVVAVIDARGCKSDPDLTKFTILDRRFPCSDLRPVISPDGDGLNEEFIINCIDELKDNHVMIFNRWGQLVFESKNYDNSWKGVTTSGEVLPDGAYYFVLEYTDNEGKRIQTKGSITLLRQE